MRLAAGLTTALLTLTLAGPVSAGPYADTLGKCLVSQSSEADRVLVVRTIFEAMSSNPKVSDMVAITADQRVHLERGFAELTVRLLTKDCRKEAIEALKYEGASVIEGSFRILGEAAATDLMSSPASQAENAKMGEYLDKNALEALLKEAGVGG